MQNSSDRWIKCIAKGGNLIATAITGVDLVESARTRHQLSSAETVALGEALMANLLLASNCKDGERVSLSLKGDRFFKQAITDAQPSGTARGFIISRDAALSANEEMGPWQNGILTVTRLKKNESEPYVGAVPNVTGHLAKDITFYLSQSEQVPSAVGLAVNVDSLGKVESAGAFLIQIMPGATLEEIKMVEQNIHDLSSLAKRLTQDSNPTSLLGSLFGDMTFSILEEKPVHFSCNCSKERVTRAIKLLGVSEIKNMIEEDNGAKVNCDFCAAHYNFTENELENLMQEILKK